MVQADCALRPVAVILPAADVLPFRSFFVLKIDGTTNRVTISAKGGSLVNGQASFVLTGPFNGAWLWSDGAGWFTQPGTVAGATAPSGAAGGDLAGFYPNPTLGLILAAGGPVGDATHVPIITWDAKGRLIIVSSALITGVAPGGPAGGDLTGLYPDPDLTTTGVTPGTYGDSMHVARFTVDAKGRLTFATNVSIPLGGAGGTPPTQEVPAGARPGTVFTLTGVPSILLLRRNNLWLNQVGGAPGLNEYSLAGNTITTGDTIGVGDDFDAVWFAAGAGATPNEEDPAGARPGTAFTLSGSPTVLLLRRNRLWLAQVGAVPGLNEYTLAGSAITTGDTIGVGDDLHAVWF